MNQDRESLWSPDRERTGKRTDVRLREAISRARMCTCKKCEEWAQELEALMNGKSLET